MEEISNTLHSKREQQSSQTEHEPHKMRRASPEFRPDNPTRYLRIGSNFCRRVHLNQRKQRALVTGFPATLLTSSAYQEKFVVVSYNILGVDNASKHSDMYHNVLPKYMKWKRGKRLIRKEVNSYNASIVCFQEVDCFDDLANKFRKDGFEGVYKVYPFASRKYRVRQFWASSQCCSILCFTDHFKSDVPTQKPLKQCNQSMCLVVGNIHVLFNPTRGDIKLGQVRLFLEKAHKLSLEWDSTPVIIAGDLNSTPQIMQVLPECCCSWKSDDRTADVFQDRSNLNLSTETSHLMYAGTDIRFLIGVGKKLSLQQEVKGSCRTRDSCEEPLATSYHAKFMGTVDYIWHTEELVPVRVLERPINILKGT